MEYGCNTHGIWDANKESGCPACMREAREEIARLKQDAERLDWLEQHAWATERECFDFVDSWRTPDGKRHGAGLRAAIDAAMMPNAN